MRTGQCVQETGCGCQVQPLRRFSSVLNVFAQFAMEEEWIPLEPISSLFHFIDFQFIIHSLR